MKTPLFRGTCTALVTPFQDGKVNFSMLEILIGRQMEAGIPAVVLCGTTGEAPTLSDEEKLEIFRKGKEIAGKDLLILAGTGSNCTDHAVSLSKSAEDCGVDGLLVVSPYYNKATPSGLVAHYRAVAEAVDLPVILYNVPTRTGVDISVEVCKRLGEIPNIAGIKEAKADLNKVGHLIRDTALPVWCGNDDLTVPVMSLGGQGVISVVSNLFPEKMKKLTDAAMARDYRTAAAVQLELLPLTEALFSEVNPIPVKAGMQLMGLDCGDCRLPLTAMSPENRDRLAALLP